MKILGIAAVLAALLGTSELKIKADGVKINFEMPSEKVKGSVSGFQATINFDKENVKASSIEGTVDVNTLETGTKMRDKHLKSNDFFDAEKYPTIGFKSTEIMSGGDSFRMKGMIEIEDKSHEAWVSFTYKDKVFKGTTEIDLMHYDLGKFSKGEAGEHLVKINFMVPVE